MPSLKLDTFAVAGHDWGARAAYILGALFPERVTRIVGVALAYQPRGALTLPPFSQASGSGISGSCPWTMVLVRCAPTRRDSRGFNGTPGAHPVGSTRPNSRPRTRPRHWRPQPLACESTPSLPVQLVVLVIHS
jgi:pimeloyl-ACP methyl ester carboxylesterase